jgi:hypothetical protein
MNIKTLFLVVLLITLGTQIGTSSVCADTPMTINIISPKNNEHVNADLVILKVNVTTNEGLLPWARVDYYVDGKFLKTDFTSPNAINLGESAVWYRDATIGVHTWYVKVSKQGYIDKTSSTYRVYADFYPELTLTSPYGSVYGNGTYPKNQKITFGVTPTTVYIDNVTRSIFTGWVSHSTGGYTGMDSQHLITLSADIEEEATWKTQYYLNVSTEFGDSIAEGWYDEGTQITLDIQTDEGYRFLEWRGTGQGSYTGATVNASITVDGPITEKAMFTPLAVHELLVLSDYGETTGSGSKYEGSVANFSVVSETIQLSDGERLVFDGWTSEYPNGYNGPDNPANVTMTNYIIEEARWKKEYYVSVNDPEYISLEKWYPENKAVNLEQKTDGFLIRRTLSYKINGEKTASFNIVVTEPLQIEVYWTSDYLYAIILVGAIAIVFIAIIYRIMKM